MRGAGRDARGARGRCCLEAGRSIAVTMLLATAWLAFAPAASADPPRAARDARRVERVLTLENERLALMPAVAAWKWQHHSAVTDAARERAIIAATARLARPLGLDVGPVERLFELQMRLARDVEADQMDRWRREGFRFAGPVPDLSRDLRPRLDRLTGALLRALRLALPAFSRPDFPVRYAPAADRRLTARGWTRATRHELLAALAAIRPARRAVAPPAP